jgi:hypothetical protein
MNQQNRFAGIPDESGTMASGIKSPLQRLNRRYDRVRHHQIGLVRRSPGPLRVRKADSEWLTA